MVSIKRTAVKMVNIILFLALSVLSVLVSVWSWLLQPHDVVNIYNETENELLVCLLCLSFNRVIQSLRMLVSELVKTEIILSGLFSTFIHIDDNIKSNGNYFRLGGGQGIVVHKRGNFSQTPSLFSQPETYPASPQFSSRLEDNEVHRGTTWFQYTLPVQNEPSFFPKNNQ